MRQTLTLFLTLTLTAIACQSATGTIAPTAPALGPASDSTSTPHASVPEATVTPAEGVIFVDTLEQEVYPFVENGKCSLGEAIFSANSGASKDSCARGVPGKTIIELMPGEYHFTQRDQTPPQVEWMVSVVNIGDAVPPIIFPLSIRGNGASLVRDDDAEPFRFFELMTNATLALTDMTLQNGDVLDDLGGAIYSMSASIDLDGVRFVDNRAGNGGAVYLTLSGLNVSNCEFTRNHSTNNGGAVFIDSSKSTIRSTHFEENSADGQGGALHAETVTLVIMNDIFMSNRVTGAKYGSRGGGIYANHVNLTITDSQFYQNESPMYGGAISVNNPIMAGIDPEDGDPIEQLQENSYVSGMLTSIPGFQSTLEAHPSGVFVGFHEDAQIHNNCFANNITVNPENPNWTSGLLGLGAVADGNYWGDPSGPSGMGPGSGDSVGKRHVVFAPFLTEAPSHCDPDLAQKH